MASIARVQLEEPHTVMVACSAGLVSLIELISIPFISSLHSAKGKSFFFVRNCTFYSIINISVFGPYYSFLAYVGLIWS